MINSLFNKPALATAGKGILALSTAYAFKQLLESTIGTKKLTYIGYIPGIGTIYEPEKIPSSEAKPAEPEKKATDNRRILYLGPGIGAMYETRRTLPKEEKQQDSDSSYKSGPSNQL